MEGWSCSACGHANPPEGRFCGGCGTPRPLDARAARPVPAPAPAPPPPFRSPPAAAPEERRLITAVFADLSGFTGLVDRLDAEAVLEVIDPVIARLSNVIAGYGGYVEKYAGDALLALFGAPVSHGDDAERALLATIDLHAALAAMLPDLPPDAGVLTLHVGVSSGHGIARMLGSEARMDYAVLGDSVIVAQRLESQAPAGETYVADTTVRLVGERFSFEPLGELALKGKSKAVLAWRLQGLRAPDAATAAPSPAEDGSPGSRSGAPGIVGRLEALTAIQAMADGLTAGSGPVLALIGDAGFGKTTLADAGIAALRATGIRVLATRGVSYGAARAYRPIAELLRAYAGSRIDESADVVDARLSEALDADGAGGALPALRHVLGLAPTPAERHLEPEAMARAIVDAVVDWLAMLARRGSVAIVVDDLHWVEAASMDILLALAERVGELRLGLLVTARTGGELAVDRLFEAAGSTATTARVRVGPLDRAGLTDLLVSRLGSGVPDRLIDVVVERTAGSPFFAAEMIQSLTADGSLRRRGGAWQLVPGWDPSAVPDTIEHLLAARIDTLDPEAARVLGVAAVIGRRVRVPVLTDVVGGPIDAAVTALIAGGLVSVGDAAEADMLVFHQPLIQEVAYGRVLRRRRRELHAAIAAAIEARYGDGDDVIDLLAGHRYLADAGPAAVSALRRAAERARSLFANDEAILDLERALEVAAADPAMTGAVPALRLGLADLRRLVGDYGVAEELYRAVAEATDDPRAWAGAAASLRDRGETATATELLDARLAEPATGDPRPLFIERARTRLLVGETDGAIDDARAGLTAVPAEDRLAGGLRLQLARALAEQERADDARPEVIQALATFEALEDLPGTAQALRLLGDVDSQRGDPAGARAALERGITLARAVGSSDEIGACLLNLGFVEADDEAWDRAIDLNRQAVVEFERIDHATGRITALANLADCLFHAHRLAEAAAAALEAVEAADRISHVRARADARDTLAMIALADARPRDAAAQAEAAAADYAAAGTERRAAESWRFAAEAWTSVGEGERAAAADRSARAADAHL